MPDLVHWKHQNDDYPVCWGIKRIVAFKHEPDQNLLVTSDSRALNCRRCINVLNGGTGDPMPFVKAPPLNLAPSQFHGSMIPSRAMRKHRGLGD